jgi:hypothetical protein
MITFKPAAAPANAEPTIIPSSIKVESNNVLMKNLRIMGPTLSCLSVSRKVFNSGISFVSNQVLGSNKCSAVVSVYYGEPLEKGLKKNEHGRVV